MFYISVDCVENEPIVAESNECMRMINAAKTYHLLPKWSGEDGKKDLQIRSIHKESKVYVVGGEVHQKVRVVPINH